jgi:hypothetical protein
VSVKFTSGTPNALKSVLTIPTENVDPPEVANGTDKHKAQVIVMDASDNEVPGAEVKFQVVAPDGSVQNLTPSGPTLDDGIAVVEFSETVAGTYTVHATIQVLGQDTPVTGDPATATFIPGPPVVASSEIDVTRTVVEAAPAKPNGYTEATVTLKDQNGNLVGAAGSGRSVEILTSLGTVGTVGDNGDGTYTARVSSAVAGTATISFKIDQATSAGGPPHTRAVQFVATPTKPNITYANADHLVGTADRNVTITVTTVGGVVIGTIMSDGNGRFDVHPLQPTPAHGDTLTAIATDSHGFVSDPSHVTVDSVPPTPPTTNPSNGTEITGEGDPGTTIVITDDDGTVLCETVADPVTGAYVCRPLTPKPGDGETITVISIDDSNNPSNPVEVVIDGTPPPPPVIDNSDGSIVYGDSEPGSNVTVRDDLGNELCDAVADPQTGAFSCVPTRPVQDEERLQVVSSDPAGNSSAPSTVVVDQSAVPPPIVKPSNGSEVTGTGVPGSTVVVTFPDGTQKETNVNPNGNWTVEPPAAWVPVDNQPITVEQKKPFNRAAEKVSEPVVVRTDTVAPDAPGAIPTDGTTVNGTGEPGAALTIRDPEGRVIGETVVDGGGRWVARLNPSVAEGVMLSITQTDVAGNTSTESRLRVGKIRLALEKKQLYTGEEQTGTVYNLQPGETVSAKMFSDPIDLGQTVADSNGTAVFKWTIDSSVDTKASHHVEATGTISGLIKSEEFVVSPNQPPVIPMDVTVTPKVTTTATPTRTITQGTVVVPKAVGQMPKTGAEGMVPAIGGALGALLAGLFLVLAAARRRRQLDEK